MARYVSKGLTHFQILQRDFCTNEAIVVFDNGEEITYKTGGPYVIDTKQDIYVGDIWVMAGQSNMRGHGFLHTAFRNDKANEILDQVHLFDSTEKWRVCSDPTHQLYTSKRTVHHTLPDPTVKNPEICKYRGASLGPAFGAHYEKGVPVGLVASAHGGVSLKDWERPKELNAETCDTTLYGAMMDRIKKVGGHIAGLLWYQGESDTLRAEDANTYGDRFKQWINLLRADTTPNLPIVFVQLGPHRIDVLETVKNWMTVQDEQRRLIGVEDYMTGVSSIDCGLDDRLHLSKDGLDILGRRLAKAAILTRQGKAKNVTLLPKSAIYEKMVCISSLVEVYTVKLKFNLPPNFRFDSGGSDIDGFELQDEKNNIAVLRARLEEDGESIRLYVTGDPLKGSSKASVRYGMNQIHLNLNHGEDCVLPAFRNLEIKNKE